MKNAYTVTYEAAAFAGESGFSYRILRNGREVGSGWSRGRKRDAEQQASGQVNELEQGRAA